MEKKPHIHEKKDHTAVAAGGRAGRGVLTVGGGCVKAARSGSGGAERRRRRGVAGRGGDGEVAAGRRAATGVKQERSKTAKSCIYSKSIGPGWWLQP